MTDTNIYYDVYIATDIKGPWTKKTSSPLLDELTGNHYIISGLTNDQLYYIMVIAGKYNNDGPFIGICGQPIVSTSSSGETGPSNPSVIMAKPTLIPTMTTSMLGFSIEISLAGGP